MSALPERRSSADLFAIPDFAQASKWLDQRPQRAATESPFFSATLKDVPPRYHLDEVVGVVPQYMSQDFFKLPFESPELESAPDATLPDDTAHESANTREWSKDDDLWIGLAEPTPAQPSLRTWDRFTNPDSAQAQPVLVSEAGPRVYDALLCWSIDPLDLRNATATVVEAKPYFTSLLALALGRESVFFARDSATSSFKPRLADMRISGFSKDVLREAEDLCHESASMLLQLQGFVQSSYVRRTSRCGIAFASALEQTLQSAQKHVATHGNSPRSLLQLQHTIRSLVAVLRPLAALVDRLGNKHTDEYLLDLIFRQTFAVEHEDEYLRQMMREILRRASQPWTEFVEEWIGTRAEKGIPCSKSDVGMSKGFVKVEAEAFVDDSGQELQDIDFRLDPDKIPRFLPVDVAESMFETGRSLRFIRTCHPKHPLSQAGTLNAIRPPAAEWFYDWNQVLDLEHRVEKYRASLLEAIEQNRIGLQVSSIDDSLSADKEFDEWNFFGLDGKAMDVQLQASMDHFDRPVAEPGNKSELAHIVRLRITQGKIPAKADSESSPHWSLLPVLCFGSITAVQAQVVNRESLKLLFDAHNLREHLSLQRDFHLLGNGMFSGRLSHALFDPEYETAERQAGVARRGGVMGLRLGGRKTWPPASSELRLALMGVLVESYLTGLVDPLRMEIPDGRGQDTADLPGDLSFSVRDLSPDDIDKCMDPDSLEALDFLRLSYKAPPELAAIITSQCLMQYDRIFKMLLRVLRMLFVTGQIFREVTWGKGRSPKQSDPAAHRFVHEAQHFVSNVAAYFMDSGIAVPWSAFEIELEQIRDELGNAASSSQTSQLSPGRLRASHTRVLEQVMQSLLLRKRQQPVLKLLEDTFRVILRFAKSLRLRAMNADVSESAIESPKSLYIEFRKNVQVFITVCRGLAEKSRSGVRKNEDDKGRSSGSSGEGHAIVQLLTKLDMFDYYCKR